MDPSQAAAPIIAIGGDDEPVGTPHQTATARHSPSEAAELVADYLGMRAEGDEITEVTEVEATAST